MCECVRCADDSFGITLRALRAHIEKDSTDFGFEEEEVLVCALFSEESKKDEMLKVHGE
jgi:hypothetical protein